MMTSSQNYRVSGAVGDRSHDLWHYVALLRRRWWLVMTTGLVAFATGWWTLRDSLPGYTAETLLQEQVASSGAVIPWMIGGGQLDFGSHLDIIRSTQVIGPVVDSLGLQLRLRTHRSLRTSLIQSVKAERGAPRGRYYLQFDGVRVQLLADSRGRVVSETTPGGTLAGPGFELTTGNPVALEDLVEISITNFDVASELALRKLAVEQGSGMDLIWLRATDPDPQFAADFVNLVAEAYVFQRARNVQQQATRTKEVIASQMAHAGDSLRAVEQHVIDYEEQSRLANPQAEGGALTAELLSVDASRRSLRSDVRILDGLVRNLGVSGRSDESLQQILSLGSNLVPGIQQLGNQLRDLQLQRSNLTGNRFGATANDPRVQNIDAQIALLGSSAKSAARDALSIKRTLLAEENIRYGELRGAAGALPGQSAVYGRLEGQVEAAKHAYDNLVARYYEAQIAEGIAAGDINIVAPAEIPVLADRSVKGFQLSSALLVGLLLGLLGALLLDQLDSRVRRAFDAERATSLEVVGTIPNIRALSADETTAQIGKDAFRNLRTHLRFASDKQPGVVAVTSATPRDGKSTVAANLALTLAEQGGNTLLIEADLRRPQVHRTFGMAQAPGLSDVLLERVSLEEAITVCPENPNLDVLPCGEPVANPTELIGGSTFESILETLREKYGSIIVDTPPLLAVTDAALVAAIADGTLIVVRANKTDQEALENGVNQLRRLRVKLLGIVLNGVPMGRSGGYSYSPSYYPSYAASGVEDTVEKRRSLLNSGNKSQKAS